MDATKEASFSFVLQPEQSLTGTALNAWLKRTATGMVEDISSSQMMMYSFLDNTLSSSWQRKLTVRAHQRQHGVPRLAQLVVLVETSINPLDDGPEGAAERG